MLSVNELLSDSCLAKIARAHLLGRQGQIVLYQIMDPPSLEEKEAGFVCLGGGGGAAKR